MKELFLALGTLYLLRQLGLSGWWDLPIILIFLLIDFALAQSQKKAQAELEAMKLFIGKK